MPYRHRGNVESSRPPSFFGGNQNPSHLEASSAGHLFKHEYLLCGSNDNPAGVQVLGFFLLSFPFKDQPELIDEQVFVWVLGA
jgi:hypothetical protein